MMRSKKNSGIFLFTIPKVVNRLWTGDGFQKMPARITIYFFLVPTGQMGFYPLKNLYFTPKLTMDEKE